ncbi:unnamed protein product [Linum tenue]|uniref:Uncharacterized protein n=1 Tax=Linum tenue TaxID=586396 RepID=A0AAV0LBW8_9ROSI|nr:unnamed protein product [Linum tenue]
MGGGEGSDELFGLTTVLDLRSLPYPQTRTTTTSTMLT